MGSGQLLLSWPEPVCLSSGCSSMPPVSAPFWHVSGTGMPLDAVRSSVSIVR